jgi:hypothetical protein
MASNMFQAREEVVVANLLRHSNREWEGVSWQENPLTRFSSQGGVVVGTFPLHHSKCDEEGLW